MTWIKVSERLPDQYKEVLAYCTNEEELTFYQLCQIDKNNIWYDTLFGERIHHVIHWMSLPDKPKD